MINGQSRVEGGRGEGGEYSQKNYVYETLTLAVTKVCDIPYFIYDLTKISNPIGPEPYIKILFQTCIIIGSLVQTNVKLLYT